jgi:hypothetical protein
VEALELRVVLSAPPLPTITGPTFNITTYGAVANGTTDNTADIQACINAASATAVSEANSHSSLVGAVVEVPAASAAFESGPITVPSNIDLQIDSGAELQMLPYGTYDTSSPGTTFIQFNGNDKNVELTGSGTIDGQGSAWWTAYNANHAIVRPFMINFNTCNTLLVNGVTLQNGPTEHLTFSNCTNVTIDNLTVSAPSTSPNTDGIDPAGTNILVENCNVSVGDDDIVMKPQDCYCSNITVTNCTIGGGHGLSIGGETNDGLNGMTISNITFNNTIAGIRLKAARGQGGLVQNVSVNNVTMNNVEYPININSYYNQGSVPTTPTDPAQTVTSLTPIWQNISISNLTATMTTLDSNYKGSYCGIIWGLPEEPVNGVTLSNVNLQGRYGMDLNHDRGITFDSNCTLTAVGGGGVEISTDTTSTPYDADVTYAGYTDQDVGSPATAGTSLYNPNTYLWTITSQSTGLGSTSDQFNFASLPISGNAALRAEVSTQSNSNAAATSGVMIRETTAASAAFAAALVTPSDGVMFQWRSADGGTLQSTTVTGKAAPLYVEIAVQGSSFSAYYSTNGSTWTQIGSTQTITMNSSALEGLAVASNASGTTGTTTFTNVDALPGWLAPLSVASWNSTTSTLAVTGATSIIADPGTSEPLIQASGSAAVLALNPTSGIDIHIGGLNLTSAAKATVTSLGAARSLTNYHLLVIGTPGGTAAPTFSIDSTSTLDLADNDMAILYGTGTSPLPLVQDYLQTACDSAKWDKPGLTSSVAPTTSGATGLGYATSTELGITTFDGLSLGGNALLVKYTLTGDTTLSGTVSGSDYNTVLANYDANGDWSQGNFDYSGTYSSGTFTNGQIAGQDYNIVLAAFDNSLASYLAAPAAAPSTQNIPATAAISSPTATSQQTTASHHKATQKPHSGTPPRVPVLL